MSTAGALYVGVSTKMYLGYRDSLEWLNGIRREVDSRPALAAGRVVPFVIPSFPVLSAAADLLAGSPVVLGAQDCGWADGPWTGEVSPSMLAELGVGLVEIGHAERRRYFSEDNAMVSRKVAAALDAGITPLLCVGEDTVAATGGADVRAEAAAAFVHGQVEAAVGGEWALATRLVIAYEPVWAIGAAEPADAGYVTAVVHHLKTMLDGHAAPIIYGGSAKPGLLPTLDGVSGLFLGRFAHDPSSFGRVLEEALVLTEGVSPPRQPAG